MSQTTTQKPFASDQVRDFTFSICETLSDYHSFLRLALALLEDHVQKVSPSRLEELIRIFIRATELEIDFWNMGLSDQKM